MQVNTVASDGQYKQRIDIEEAYRHEKENKVALILLDVSGNKMVCKKQISLGEVNSLQMQFSDDGNFLAIYFTRFHLLQIYERGENGSIEQMMDAVEKNNPALNYLSLDNICHPKLKFDASSHFFALFKGLDVMFFDLRKKDDYKIFRQPFKLSRKYASILDLQISCAEEVLVAEQDD